MSDAMPQMLRWYWFLPDGRYVPIEDAAMQEVRPTRPCTPAVPQSKYVPPAGWRRLAVGETLTEDAWVIDPFSGTGRPTSQAGQLVEQNQIYICRIGPERQPQPERVQVCEGRWLTRSGAVRNVTPTPTEDPALMAELFPWCDPHTPDGRLRTWRDDGRYDTEEGEWDLVKYLGPLQVEPDKTQEPQPEFTIPEGWRRLQVGEILQPGDQIVQIDDGRRYPTHRVGDAVGEKQQYIRLDPDAGMTEELHRILQRCEANETAFDNQDMSVVLQEVYRLRRIIISEFG
ncbi:MAG: hypothetical protein ACK528_09420 [Alphaproteobacteria bacterium]